jgi:hypothetical protein
MDWWPLISRNNLPFCNFDFERGNCLTLTFEDENGDSLDSKENRFDMSDK